MDDSDTSFQIPTASSSNLLADDTIDFLDGVDATLATPAAPARKRAAKLDAPLTLGELTPRSRKSRATPQVTLRRSPRKHRGTPAIPSPLKKAVAADMSAAMDDTLSPFKRPLDQSFQIPSMMNATTDLLMMDDGDSMFGKGPDASFGEGPAPVAMQSTQEALQPLSLSELESPAKVPQPSPTIRSMSPPEQNADERRTPNPADRYERPRSPSPVPSPTLFSTLQETAEALPSEAVVEQPRQCEVEVVPSSPPPQPVEVNKPTSHGLINLPVDGPYGDMVPAESSWPDATEETSPAPGVAHAHSPAAEAPVSEAKQEPATPAAGGAVKQSRRRSSIAARKTAAKPSKKSGTQRRTRASSVATAEPSSNVSNAHAGPSSQGFSAVSELDAVPELEVPCGGEPPSDITEMPPSCDMLVDPSVFPSVPASELQRDQEEAKAQTPGTLDSPADEDRDLDCPFIQEMHAAEVPVSPTNVSPVPERIDTVEEQRTQEHSGPSVKVEQVQDDCMDVDVLEQTPQVPALPAVPLSPMRPATKRSASAAENDLPEAEPLRKKAKVAPSINAARVAGGRTNSRTTQPRAKPAGAAPTSTLAAKRSVRVLRSSRLKNASAAPSSLSKSSGSGGNAGLTSSGNSTASSHVGDNSVSANTQKPSTKSYAAEKPPTVRSHLTASSSSSKLTVPVPFNLHASGASSAQAHLAAGQSVEGAHAAGKQRHAPPPAPAAKSMGHSDGSTQMRKAVRMPIPERLTASHPAAAAAAPGAPAPAPAAPAKLTKPIEFHFHSEARIEARKAGDGSSTAKRPRDPALAVPDFAALQARHAEAVAAGRRQGVHPTVPVAPPLRTEARAQERERFEEARRAREAELERQRAEARRAQAQREEEELRELRRRAVPKAHEVPAWYAHAPKRSHDDAQT